MRRGFYNFPLSKSLVGIPLLSLISYMRISYSSLWNLLSFSHVLSFFFFFLLKYYFDVYVCVCMCVAVYHSPDPRMLLLNRPVFTKHYFYFYFFLVSCPLNFSFPSFKTIDFSPDFMQLERELPLPSFYFLCSPSFHCLSD